MQNALQGLGLAVPPAVPPEVSVVHLSDQPEEGDERVPTDEEEELEEEQMEGSIGDGVEQLEGVVIDRESLIDSLNSSYEDLIVPEGEGVVVRVGRRERVSLLDAEPKLNGDQGKNESERDEVEKKGKVGQDITSEPDIPIDSSAEEDNGKSVFYVLSSNHLSTYSSISTHPSIHPSILPPVHISIYPSIHPSIHSIHSSIHSFIHFLFHPFFFFQKIQVF